MSPAKEVIRIWRNGEAGIADRAFVKLMRSKEKSHLSLEKKLSETKEYLQRTIKHMQDGNIERQKLIVFVEDLLGAAKKGPVFCPSLPEGCHSFKMNNCKISDLGVFGAFHSYAFAKGTVVKADCVVIDALKSFPNLDSYSGFWTNKMYHIHHPSSKLDFSKFLDSNGLYTNKIEGYGSQKFPIIMLQSSVILKFIEGNLLKVFDHKSENLNIKSGCIKIGGQGVLFENLNAEPAESFFAKQSKEETDPLENSYKDAQEYFGNFDEEFTNSQKFDVLENYDQAS